MTLWKRLRIEELSFRVLWDSVMVDLNLYKDKFVRKATREENFYDVVKEIRGADFKNNSNEIKSFMIALKNDYVHHQIKQVILEAVSVAGYDGNKVCREAIRNHFKTQSGGVNYKEVDDCYYLLKASKSPKSRRAFLTCVMG